MGSLIHLNGPPGIGKSTLAALFVERHPRSLNLDIDRLHQLVGGWQDPATHTHELLRPVALAMAAAHLRQGADVVVPQYLAQLSEVAAFERVAFDQVAQFREVVLLDDKAASVARFDRRPDQSAWDRRNREVVAEQGGVSFLATMYDRLLELVDQYPSALVVRSEAGKIEQTYRALMSTLAGLDPQDVN